MPKSIVELSTWLVSHLCIEVRSTLDWDCTSYGFVHRALHLKHVRATCSWLRSENFYFCSKKPSIVKLPPFFESTHAGMCLEKRAFYRVISGLHASINIHLSAEHIKLGKCPSSMCKCLSLVDGSFFMFYDVILCCNECCWY